MKTFKTLMALLLALALMCTLFVPVFAASGSDTTPADDEGEEEGGSGRVEEDILPGSNVDVIDPLEGITDTPVSDTQVIKSVAIDPVRVLDYSKYYHLATVELAECAKVKWYVLYEDGSIFTGGKEEFTGNGHHGRTYIILWNALDNNGTHPAGKWNDPAIYRLSLVIIATSIPDENGAQSDDVAEAYFYYAWYDGENAPAAAGAAAGPQSASVPHTGL